MWGYEIKFLWTKVASFIVLLNALFDKLVTLEAMEARLKRQILPSLISKIWLASGSLYFSLGLLDQKINTT